MKGGATQFLVHFSSYSVKKNRIHSVVCSNLFLQHTVIFAVQNLQYSSGDEDFIEFSHRESVDEILMDLSRFIRKNSGHE